MSEVKIPQSLLNVIADINVEEINSHIYTNEKLVSWLCSWHEEIKRELYDFANNRAEQIRADAIDDYAEKINTLLSFTDLRDNGYYVENLVKIARNELISEQLKGRMNMLFPDVKNDDCYNVIFLNDEDAEFVRGMHFMRDQVINLFENNLATYEGRLEIDTEIDVDKFLDKAKDELAEMVRDWCGMEIDEMVTSMLDNTDEDEYEANREKFIKEHPEDFDKFYNTRKYMCTGKKEKSN